MSIQGQINLNIVQGSAAQSDDLYTAFTKIQNNFNNLFIQSSPYNTFNAVPYSDSQAQNLDPLGNGISVVTNSLTGVVNIMNTGVTNINAGTGITIDKSRGNITISAKNSTTGSGISSVGINSTSLKISGSPLLQSGVINVDLYEIPTQQGFAAGTYSAATVTVDKFGRVTRIADTTSFGTVTSVNVLADGPGLKVTGGPITSSGTITITNTGVTGLNAGPGISLSSTSGIVTISVDSKQTQNFTPISSQSLSVTGSGTIKIEIPKDPTFTGNTTIDKLLANTANFANDVYINGNLHVMNLVSTSSTTLNVTDPLLYLTSTSTYPYSYDIGFYSHFATASSAPTGYQHTGFVRNHNNNTWTLFSNLAEPSGGQVNLADTNIVYDAIRVGNITSTNANLGNLVTANYSTAVLTNGNQSNITSVGTLVNLNVTGNLNAANFIGNLANGNSYVNVVSNGNITLNAGGGTAELIIAPSSINVISTFSVSGNLTSLNANLGNLAVANYVTGTLTTNNQPNVTTVGTLTNLNVSGNISSGNANLGNIILGNNATFNGNLVVNSTANVSNLIVTGNTSSNNCNVTSLITSSSLTVTSNSTLNNLYGYTSGNVVVNANLVSISTATYTIFGSQYSLGNLYAGGQNLGLSGVTYPGYLVQTLGLPATNIANGTFAIDSANNRIAIRYGGTWHYANLTP